MTQFNLYGDYINIEPLIDLFINKGEMVKYKRNECFCNVGDGCKYIGYVATGAFRFTRDGTDGKEHIISYAFENDFIGSYSSLQSQKPTLFNIQSIKDSVIYRLPISEINSFLSNTPKFQLLGRRIIEIILYSLVQQVISIYCNSPEERYIELVKRCPTILNRVSIKELSSYLMITPETLSRIRTKLLSK